MKRKIIFHKNYFIDFYLGLCNKDQEKIEYVLDMVRNLVWIPQRFFKHLEGTSGLYEIRVKSTDVNYRIFCFFDQGSIVVLLHGFIKKSLRIPKNEIRRAEKLMKNIF
jgi:phage-related protein